MNPPLSLSQFLQIKAESKQVESVWLYSLFYGGGIEYQYDFPGQLYNSRFPFLGYLRCNIVSSYPRHSTLSAITLDSEIH